MNLLKQTCVGLLVFYSGNTFAQSNFDRSVQAIVRADYKTAVAQLEKADVKDPDNAKILKMLGYSYFQNGNNEKSIATYTRLSVVQPNDVSAYYYRGKARLKIANDPKEAENSMRENFYTAAIADFTKAIELSEQDIQMYQNRGLAYKDYAIFRSFKSKKKGEKAACIAMFNSSIADFQKLLTMQPLRKDIIDWIAYDKEQIKSLRY
ncbi:MAG: tetratricopeptide repeat protein [Pedobacter sp.]|nr:tetratricopeptide repeat protein [Pedobacter sp.]